MPTEPLIVPTRLARRLRRLAATRGEAPEALLRWVLQTVLATLEDQKPLPRWWLTVLHLAEDDAGRVGLGKVLSEFPRWRAEAIGEADATDRAARLCLLRRDDGARLLVEFVPHRRKLYLFGALAGREAERALTLEAPEAWVDLSARAWRRTMAEADRVADDLAADPAGSA